MQCDQASQAPATTLPPSQCTAAPSNSETKQTLSPSSCFFNNFAMATRKSHTSSTHNLGPSTPLPPYYPRGVWVADSPWVPGSLHLPEDVPALHVGPDGAYLHRGETLLLSCFQSREGCQAAFPQPVCIHRSPAGEIERAKNKVGSGNGAYNTNTRDLRKESLKFKVTLNYLPRPRLRDGGGDNGGRSADNTIARRQ